MSHVRGVRKDPMPWPVAVFLIAFCLGMAWLLIGYGILGIQF